jgi:Concanavalin A-like lectin/glucanases superfamily
MSRYFAASSSQALTHTGAPTLFPLSMHCWANVASLTADRTILSIGDTGFSNIYLQLLVRTNGTIRFRQNDGGSPQAATSTGTVSVGTPFAVGAAFGHTSDRNIYLNGVLDGNNAVVYGNDPPAYTHTYIGRVADNGTGPQYMDGWVGEVAFWEATLTSAEWLALAAGANPMQIRPEALWKYWPLHGTSDPEIAYYGAGELALVNAPTKDLHPRVYIPGRSFVAKITPIGGGSITGTGGLTQATNVVAGSGTTTSPAGSINGTGALTISAPTTAGVSYHIINATGSGDNLAVGDMVIAGDAAINGQVTGTGALSTAVMVVAGSGVRWRTGTGALIINTSPTILGTSSFVHNGSGALLTSNMILAGSDGINPSNTAFAGQDVSGAEVSGGDVGGRSVGGG